MNSRVKFAAILLLMTILASVCKEEEPVPTGYDIDRLGIPRFVNTNYIDPTRMVRISRFRSSYGADYSDDFESCRNMKNAFEPRRIFDWSLLPLFYPVHGTVVQLSTGIQGSEIHIQSKKFPDFEFYIFHAKPLDGIGTGKMVKKGEQIGTHFGQAMTAGQYMGTHIHSQTLSDIAVCVWSPGGRKLISYFDTMTDSLFQDYQFRGLSERSDVIISKEERATYPLSCSGEAFLPLNNPLENWIYLNPKGR